MPQGWAAVDAEQGPDGRLRILVRKYLLLSLSRCGGAPAQHGIRDRMMLAEWLAPLYDWDMAEAIAFDTHRFVKRLTGSGFTERQAETLAEEHIALINANLATRADVAEIMAGIEVLRQETKADIAKVEARIEEAKSEILKWIFGALVAQGGLIVALVKLL